MPSHALIQTIKMDRLCLGLREINWTSVRFQRRFASVPRACFVKKRTEVQLSPASLPTGWLRTFTEAVYVPRLKGPHHKGKMEAILWME